jgi:hypothetical protein
MSVIGALTIKNEIKMFIIAVLGDSVNSSYFGTKAVPLGYN